ncbi:hypothetical protein [Arthrobacter sp. H14]|uniref:hypothetical protein n=1 Tax=Arthrobacter sp. H14 TaxID=1312959 RepID=UPI0004BB2028|nr:hypothetical protein [Arthrobacter sp. H14]
MVDSGLKGWQKASGIIADLVRFAGLLSIVAAVLWMDPGDIVRFSIAFLGLLVPRIFHLPRPFDAAYCITVLLATWSGAAGWYEAIPWWDWVVHLITNGAIAAAVYLVLARVRVVHDMHDHTLKHSRVALVVLTAAFGLAFGALWEFVEWIGEQYMPQSIHIGYVDSIGDMSAGGLGSVIAGVALVIWAAAGGGTRREKREG